VFLLCELKSYIRDLSYLKDLSAPGRESKHLVFVQEKLKIKTEKDEAEAKYKFALVDGRKEQVLYRTNSFSVTTVTCCVLRAGRGLLNLCPAYAKDIVWEC
jgi:hypothetical protein